MLGRLAAEAPLFINHVPTNVISSRCLHVLTPLSAMLDKRMYTILYAIKNFSGGMDNDVVKARSVVR